MKSQQVIFARHSAARQGDAPFTNQRALNMYAEAGDGDDYTPVFLRHSSGLRKLAKFGGPVRAISCVADVLYAAAGGQLWRVSEDGQTEALGDIPDDENSFIRGNRVQVAVSAGGKLFVYQNNSLAEATGNNAPGEISSMDYLDGFGILSISGSDQFFVTNLVDFDEVNALDFASAESKPDEIKRILVDHREVWVFGTKTIEVFYNSGGADFPFTRANEAAIERGLVGKFTPAKMENTVFWLGEDLEVKAAQGYVPQRVSTHAVERQIRALSPSQRERLRGFVLREEGHSFYCLWFPNGPAWLYDAATGMWHERATGDGPWLANAIEHAYGLNWAGGSDGGLYVVDRDYYCDDQTPIRREAISGPIKSGQNRFSALHFAADIRSGWTGYHDPHITLYSSKDRGHTWRKKGARSMGTLGQFNALQRWWGFGISREIMFKLEVTEPVALSIYAAHMAYLPGET